MQACRPTSSGGLRTQSVQLRRRPSLSGRMPVRRRLRVPGRSSASQARTSEETVSVLRSALARTELQADFLAVVRVTLADPQEASGFRHEAEPLRREVSVRRVREMSASLAITSIDVVQAAADPSPSSSVSVAVDSAFRGDSTALTRLLVAHCTPDRIPRGKAITVACAAAVVGAVASLLLPAHTVIGRAIFGAGLLANAYGITFGCGR